MSHVERRDGNTILECFGFLGLVEIFVGEDCGARVGHIGDEFAEDLDYVEDLSFTEVDGYDK